MGVYRLARQAAVAWDGQSIGGLILHAKPTSTPKPGETSVPDPAGVLLLPTPDPWNGASRVTILIMGLDYRDWQANEGPARSDTMILLTVDPLTKTAGMLSVPRDLWVSIPGMGYNKINTAMRFGELYKIPGGGPGLAMKTVELTLGVPIDYYAVIDFNAFEQFIDDLGGIDVNVPAEISVDPLGPHNTVILKPGMNHLDGATALGYARNRSTAFDDTDRSERQHQVILAIRDKILKLNMLPKLVAQAPTLYQELSSGVHTNLTLQQVIQLAWLAEQIPAQNIKSAVIGPNQVTFEKSPDGLDIDKPIMAKINELRDQIFMPSSSVSPAEANLSSDQLVQAEGAKVSLVNASGSTEAAQSLEQALRSRGIQVVDSSQATEVSATSQVTDYTGKPYTLKYLVGEMDIQPGAIYSKLDLSSPVDLKIVIGRDWARNNAAP